jgi:hypothetical protein
VRHAALDGADPAPRVEPEAEDLEYGYLRVYTRRFQRDEEQAAENGQSWHAGRRRLAQDMDVHPFATYFLSDEIADIVVEHHEPPILAPID